MGFFSNLVVGWIIDGLLIGVALHDDGLALVLRLPEAVPEDVSRRGCRR